MPTKTDFPSSTHLARGFHAGEVAVQTRTGAAAKMAELGSRLIRDHMPDQHRDLFAQLPFVLAGGLDATRQPWATLLAGPPGFIDTPDAQTLRIAAPPAAPDALAGAFTSGMPVGLLGIQPHTRRRNRVNGIVTQSDESGFAIRVMESFGNCPKYIQAREAHYAGPPEQPGRVIETSQLDTETRRIVTRADTFFIATAHPDAGTDAPIAYGVDVSHRGGKPGFVRISETQGADQLTIPDFTGNSFFNTLGNIALNPRVGLLFVDFDGGQLVQIAGAATIDHDSPERAHYAGALRLLHVRIDVVRRLTGVMALRWGREAELSPHLVATGEWTA
ncbi:MAG: pyridoxamine 5'-phosphate oxidase family protein [Azoarcus sp.]|nr:pyridoxamine 5'-phosphate oxidase family protein [Azoarcus sp.]